MLPSVYTAIRVLYCTLKNFIERQPTYLELKRSFGYRLQPNRTSLLSLLLALVASMVLLAPPPPVRALLGCHLEPGTSAEVRVPAPRLPCLASLVPSLLPNLAICLFVGKLRARTDTALGMFGSWGSATSSWS